ncbi:MFS transporter [Bauldia sp.]|uniref:MFS transporter n=1 Tax=Bauldia sp. TaxID=2575872 RepID=UPI003BA92ECD
MLTVLRNRTYRRLFLAQVIALTGTGLMTVALALLAFELAGDEAGVVLGTALAIKMIVYVGFAPFAGVIASRMPRRTFLVALDVVRAALVLALPFVDAVWQIYVIVAVLQTASALFTPTFQATISDILTDERDYTRALALSRLAYDLENLLSPALAAVLVALVGFPWLFAGTAIGFLLSAALVILVRLPALHARRDRLQSVARGLRVYRETPRLRGVFAVNLAVAAAGAMVLVNTVVLVRGILGLDDTAVAVALSAFGGGSMLAALALPRLLERTGDRTVMIAAAAGAAVLLLAGSPVLAFAGSAALWPALLSLWAMLGFCYAAAQVPVGRVLRRSSHSEDRPAVFAAQFSLSHAGWLVAYPLAGWLGEAAGMPTTFLVFGGLAALATAMASWVWPRPDPEILAHDHPDLAPDHPHLAGAGPHAHAYVVDDLHLRWPDPAR